MAIFPQEILDAIVNELDDDGAALRVCSMTSWSLLIPARRSIFHHIRIKQQDINYFGEFKHFDRDHKRLLDLSEILANDPSLHPHREGTPTLTSCIRHLDLQLASAGSHTFRGDTSAIMAAQDRWNAMNAPLPEVLHKLSPSHIELSLPCTWRQVDPSITSSILKLLRAPLIHTLDLSHIHGLPTNAVLHCPNLNDLRVRYVADQKSITDTAATEGLPCPIQPPPFEPSYPPPTLKYLTTTSDSNFLAALIKTPVNAVAFNNLQHLSFVDAWILSFDVESRVVETVAPTLRFLHIQSSNLDNRIGAQLLYPNIELCLTNDALRSKIIDGYSSQISRSCSSQATTNVGRKIGGSHASERRTLIPLSANGHVDPSPQNISTDLNPGFKPDFRMEVYHTTGRKPNFLPTRVG